MSNTKTINPGKNRQTVYNADIRQKRVLMAAHVGKDMRAKTGIRSLAVRVGDTVKIMRGDYKGKTGNINQVDHTRNKVFIQGIMRKKTDGKEAFIAFRPSNLMITGMESKDKTRMKKMTGKKEADTKTETKTMKAETKTGKKE